MFKELAKIFTSGVSQKNDDLTEEIKEGFKEDYINNKTFINKFPAHITKFVEEAINGIYESASQTEDKITLGNPIFHIFGGLRSLYISLWLEETGYGEKLALKMGQLIYTDDYGDTCFDDWNRELNRFVSDRLYKLKSYLHTSIPGKYRKYAEILDMEHQLDIKIGSPDLSMEDVVEDVAFAVSLNIDPYYDHLCTNYTPCKLDDIQNPYEYEKSISREFESLGWKSYETSGSGDQGADVIAEKNGLKLIVQCKLHSAPVGNKAVQEVSAAQGFYKGDVSAVITNSDFTKSAKQLAGSLGVYLLHHTQISALDSILFESHEVESDFSDGDLV